jgi:outer membrane protein OmpA-like peptidoglycan-associated protein
MDKARIQRVQIGVASALLLGAADLAYLDFAVAPEVFAAAPAVPPVAVEEPPLIAVLPDSEEEVQEEVAEVTAPEVEVAVVEKPPVELVEPKSWRFYFSPASAVLSAAKDARLDQVVLAARGNSAKIEIVGRADPRGESKYNLTLSEQRARAVEAWLIGHGVVAERIQARGAGETPPEGSGERGFAESRRVEVNLVPTGSRT